jgi:CRP-like cAMP-binding protein
MTSEILRYLDHCPDSIRRTFKEIGFEEGELIMAQGEPVEAVYILLEGETRVYHLTSKGINYLEYIYTRGELFGEIEALNGKAIISNVRASTKCKAIAISKAAFIQWMRADPDFSVFIGSQLADKLYLSSQASVTNITYPLRYRVLYYLWEAFQRQAIYISKEDLVAGLGSNERSVNRIVNELVEEQLVECDHGVIKLCPQANILSEMAKYE